MHTNVLPSTYSTGQYAIDESASIETYSTSFQYSGRSREHSKLHKVPKDHLEQGVLSPAVFSPQTYEASRIQYLSYGPIDWLTLTHVCRYQPLSNTQTTFNPIQEEKDRKDPTKSKRQKGPPFENRPLPTTNATDEVTFLPFP